MLPAMVEKKLPPLARRIVARRQELGLLAVTVAKRAKLHPSTLSFIENGRQEPSLRQLRRLARVLRTDPRDLIS